MVERPRGVVAPCHLKGDVRAASLDESRFGDPEKVGANAVTALRRQHEKLIDLCREAQVFEAETVNRKQIANRHAIHDSKPATPKARLRKQARKLCCDAPWFESG